MIITVKIEIPKDSRYKYEKSGEHTLRLDRVLNQPIPYNYGYVLDSHPQDDGDPLDVFLVSTDRVEPLAEVSAKILYVIKGKDNGKQDDKLVCILEGERVLDPLNRERIIRYLTTYKPEYKVESVESYETAVEIYKKSKN